MSDPVIRFEGTNARGEPSSPRVDLLAVGRLLDRAANAVEGQGYQITSLQGRPGPKLHPETRQLVNDLCAALREIRLLRCRRKRRMRWVRERD